MKPHELITPWKGDKRYTAIAKQAAALKKQGFNAEQIVAAIRETFGPPAELARVQDQPQPYVVFGEIGADIEQPAVDQLTLALRLPIAVRGALMPDAHPGYALPIGGVFAAHRAIAPAMVGVDIGCRMHLTIFEDDPDNFFAQRTRLLNDLRAVTVFGTGAKQTKPVDHELLDDPRWKLTSQLRDLRNRAPHQLGTSGSGNHFANLIVGEWLQPETNQPQRFCGLLTHSGSRSIGFAIANNYMRLAARETAQVAVVPKMYEWLSLDSEAGQEYWQAMELAGAFARTCHELIHERFARKAKLTPRQVVQNHHNFAWRDGDLVIHRKGATPAGPEDLGIIPGSMASASYIVQGRGNPDALNSAAHGAGRRGSRRYAKETINPRDVRNLLQQADVIVEGLSIDEAPQAYKNIERVIAIQQAAGLISPLARLRPIAVIMAGEAGDD